MYDHVLQKKYYGTPIIILWTWSFLEFFQPNQISLLSIQWDSLSSDEQFQNEQARGNHYTSLKLLRRTRTPPNAYLYVYLFLNVFPCCFPLEPAPFCLDQQPPLILTNSMSFKIRPFAISYKLSKPPPLRLWTLKLKFLPYNCIELTSRENIVPVWPPGLIRSSFFHF